jgi:hypothetical protein
MAEEYVTKAEMKAEVSSAISEMRKEMAEGFSKIEKQLDSIIHSIEVNQHTDLERYDARYLLREDDVPDSIERLNNPRVRGTIHPIISEYMDSADGMAKFNCCCDRYFSMKRDSTSKWISFVKTVGAIALAVAMLYGGNSVYQSNISTQQKLIESIDRIHGD